MNKKDMIDSLERKVDSLKKKISNTKDSVQAAILSDKISEARKQINELKYGNEEKNISSKIDGPFVADRDDDQHVQKRGQVIIDTFSDTETSYTVDID